MLKEDWIECGLDEVTFKANKTSQEKESGNDIFEYIDISSIDNTTFKLSRTRLLNWKNAPSRAQQIVDRFDTLFSTVRPYLKNIALIDTDSENRRIASTGFCVLKPTSVINHNLLFYYVCNDKTINEISKYQTGTSYPAVRDSDILSISFPLPPLPIQRAIVKKIEQLFSALDAGIADLKKAQEQLKLYRQAVLKKAFEGEYPRKKLCEVADVKRGKSKHRPRNDKRLFGGPYPFIQTGEIRKANGGVISKYENTYSEFGLQQSKLWPKGTLCLTIAANIGETAYLGFNACFPDSVVGIKTDDEILSLKYFNFFIQLIKSEINSKASATAQKNINVETLEDLEIPVPETIAEQNQIVKEIESRLSVCDVLEQQINTSLQQSEALRQSILKKAFAGELLTEAEIAACKKEADYEPASVLLKRIKSEKEKGRPKISKGSVVPKVKPVIAIVPKVSADIHAGLIAKIIKLHEANPAFKDKLSHIKCEKLAHLVEYHVRIPLGRKPVKDAAGPDDYHHLKSIESRARKAGFFKQKKRPIGYTYVPGNNIDKVISKFESSVSDEQNAKVNALLRHFLPFDLETAEIAATTYAGWNNLIILGNSHPADEEIVTESRENWSKRKLSIPRERFFKAINWLRKKEINLIPTGYGLLVSAPANKKK